MVQFQGLEEALSADRFETYLQWAGNDRDKAIGLYTLNSQLSEAFYAPLHMVEISLRNRIHRVMTDKYNPTWYDDPTHQLNTRQREMLIKARNDLVEAGKDDLPARMVAALTFGYWTAMIGKEYEGLWQRTLHRIAVAPDGKGLTRKKLATPLAQARTLRNRIMHHEPILHWNLPKHHAAMLELVGWLSRPAADWCRSCSRFDATYPAGGYELM